MSITSKDIEAAMWIPAGPNHEGWQVGDLKFYRNRQGEVSVAENEVWISALFESLEAAASWADDLDAAEAMFKRLNPPTGKGDNLVPHRDVYFHRCYAANTWSQ